MFFEDDYKHFGEAGVQLLEVFQQTDGADEAHYAEFRVARLQYDSAGLLVKEEQFDENGWELLRRDHWYDKKGRLVRKFEHESELPPEITEYYYRDDRLVEAAVKGEPRLEYKYDDAGNLQQISATDKKGRTAYDHRYRYKGGKVSEEQLKIGGKQDHALRYAYDEEGRRSQVDLFDHTNRRMIEDKYRYGDVKTWVRTWFAADGTRNIVTYKYDEAGQIVSAESETGLGEKLETAEYKYDAKHLRVEQTQDFYEHGEKVTTYRFRFEYRMGSA